MTDVKRATKLRSTILTIGGAMIDTIAVIDDDRIERMSMNNADKAYLLLEEGRKTEAAIISTHSGGGAINTAVSLARLGFDVATLVKLGRDERGAALRATLKAEGVSHQYVKDTEDAGTGASVMISAHDRNAAIFTYRGANSSLTAADLPAAGLTFDIVYITGLSDRSADIFPKIVDGAAAAGAFIAANPGIRQLAARGGAFQDALSKISLLSMNRAEAEAFLPRIMEGSDVSSQRLQTGTTPDSARLMKLGISAVGFELSLAQYCQAMLKLGPECIIITDGKYGAYAATATELIHCPSLPSEVVGTAGAGDAFTSTFTSNYANGLPAGEALQYATINATSVIGHADTLTGLMTKSQLAGAWDENKQKLPLTTWHFAPT